MSIYAIGDLHLSGAVHKPMDKFGSNWENHAQKIKEHWLNIISKEDTILIPGDISWGMTLEEAKIDLQFLDDLPGRKVIIKGNHDYWWKSVTKLNTLYKSIYFLQNDFTEVEGFAICGGRGWTCPNDTKFTPHDQKIYEREEKRLRLSLQLAKKAEYDSMISMIHYPPTNEKLESSIFTDLFEEYKVEKVVYGHLHGKESFELGLQGNRNGVEYELVSSDYINFQPVLLV